MIVDGGNTLAGLPVMRPLQAPRRIAPVTEASLSQERPPSAPRYLPYGPDRPSGRAAQAVHAYQSTARAGHSPAITLAGIDCYA